MKYSATLDLMSKIVTAIVSSMFLGIFIWNIWMLNSVGFHGSQAWLLMLALPLLFVVYWYCYLFRVIGYSVGNGKLVIRRTIKDLEIDMTKIQNAFIPDPDSMRLTIRTFGNGGLFGYLGLYYNPAHGNMKWYATRRDNYVMLMMKDDTKIVLTPDSDLMAQEIKRLLPA